VEKREQEPPKVVFPIRSLARRRDYFAALRQRMEKTGWYTNDPTYQSAVAAYHLIHGMLNTVPPAHVAAEPLGCRP
jgi:hypothetical protein